MTEPLRVGIIGYGQMGELHAEVWSGVPEARVVAIADPDPKRLQRALDLYSRNDCRVFPAGEEMAREAEFDIAVVATQPPDIPENVLAALERGCHVICEKPMALSLEEADQMVDVATQAGAKLAVHHQTVFTNAVQRAEKMVAEGAIGKLYFVESWGKGRPAPYDLMEVGGHVLHLMRHFAGEVDWMFGHCQQNGRGITEGDVLPIAEIYPDGRAMGIGAGDYLFGYYRFKSGVCGTLRLKTLPKGFANTEYMAVELHGTEGRLRIHQTSTSRLFYKPTPHDNFSVMCWQEVDSRNIWNPDPCWVVPMRRFAEDFIAAIREDRAPKVSGEDGRAVLEMTLGIYASHFEATPVPLPLEYREHPLALFNDEDSRRQ